MRFNWQDIVFNPYFLTFVTVMLGLLLGDMKRLGRFRLGVSGPLFVGLGLGWLVWWLAERTPPHSAGYPAARAMLESGVVPSMLQTLVLILFIAAIGLLASRDLKLVLRRYGAQFVALGLIVTVCGAGLSYATTFLNPKTNIYEAAGVYTGALTSSPGLGAALESAQKHSGALAEQYPALSRRQLLTARRLVREPEELRREGGLSGAAASAVGTGYAVSYPFGVISVIVGLMLMPRLLRIDTAAELAAHRREMQAMRGPEEGEEPDGVHFDLKSYALVCTLGYLLGNLELGLGRLGSFSLGATGGVLITSVGLGYLGRVGPFVFRMDGKTLGASRDLALGLYLGMVGLTYGYRVVQAVAGAGLYLAVSSLLIGTLSMMAGFVAGRRLFGLNWVLLSGAVCGGMTSTPGLGLAINMLESDEPGAGYAATYPSALIGMTLFTIILYNLP